MGIKSLFYKNFLRDKNRKNKYLTDPPSFSPPHKFIRVADSLVATNLDERGVGGKSNRSATPPADDPGTRVCRNAERGQVFGNSKARAIGHADTAGASCRRFVVSAKKYRRFRTCAANVWGVTHDASRVSPCTLAPEKILRSSHTLPRTFAYDL